MVEKYKYFEGRCVYRFYTGQLLGRAVVYWMEA